jgi:hypothetical protein
LVVGKDFSPSAAQQGQASRGSFFLGVRVVFDEDVESSKASG